LFANLVERKRVSIFAPHFGISMRRKDFRNNRL
jgi:hypothetical protein